MMKTLTLIILVFLCALPASLALLGEPTQKGKVSDPPTTAKVSMEIKDLPVSIAITRLFADYGLGDILNKESLKSIDRKVSANMTNVPWTAAVAMLSQSAGLTYSVTDGKYSFASSPRQYSQVLQAPTNANVSQFRNQQQSIAANRNDMGVAKVTPRKKGVSQVFDLTLDQANVFDVIRQLMDLSKRDYVLDIGPAADYGVAPPRITAKLSNVSVDEFLSMLKSNSDIKTQKTGKQTAIRWQPKWAGYRGSYMLNYTVLAGGQVVDRGRVSCLAWQRMDWTSPNRASASVTAPRPAGTAESMSVLIKPASDTEVLLDLRLRTRDTKGNNDAVGSVQRRIRLGEVVRTTLEDEIRLGLARPDTRPRLTLVVSVTILN